MDARVLEIRASDFETLPKSAIRLFYAQIFAQDNNRLARRIEDGVGKFDDILQICKAAFHLVDFDQGDNRSVDLIIKRPIWSNPELVPAIFRIAHLSFAGTQGLDYFADQGNKIGNVQGVRRRWE